MHEPLESCWGILESEGHNVELEEALSRGEASLLPVIRVNGNSPEAALQIKSGEVLGLAKEVSASSTSGMGKLSVFVAAFRPL